MRKITSKKEQEKKQRRNQLIIGLILIVVMFFSVVGYGFLGSDQKEKTKLEYNGQEFTSQNGFWFLNKGDYLWRFSYSPEEFGEEIIIGENISKLNNYLGKPLYFVASNIYAETEIAGNLEQVTQRIQYACISEEGCESGLPMKNCSDSNIILIEESQNREISQQENCVFIRGPKEELIQMGDEFLFRILEVK